MDDAVQPYGLGMGGSPRRWVAQCVCAGMLVAGGCEVSSRSSPLTVAPEDDGGSEPVDPAALNETLGRCSDFDELRRPFFGDTHVHTSLSLDAALKGTRLTPADAYRFARGDELELPPYDADGRGARRMRLTRPLDFVALSDHAEFLGLTATCETPGAPGHDSAECEQYRSDPALAFVILNALLATAQSEVRYPDTCDESNDFCRAAAQGAWEQVQASAEDAYDRSAACEFTSFVAYEWSGSPGGRNLHRNVIFRNHHVPASPASYLDGGYPERLWSALDSDCLEAGTGCDVLSIPHNSNLGAGLLFEQVQMDGAPFDEDYVADRRRHEPLVEIFQHKSDSECLPDQAEGGDPLCSFEKTPYHTLAAVAIGGMTRPEPNPADYVRHALAEGLKFEQQLGTNPFAFGFIGSTDTHQAIPGATDEENFAGHGGAGLDPSTWSAPALPDLAWSNPGGLAVVWAEENSREAIFQAMRRRETYGTSGPRMVLRFFGGPNYPDNLCQMDDFAAQGYAGGVPMGGDLVLSSGESPRFAVSVMRDPGTAEQPGMPLQRLQIIKGSLVDGESRYQVYEVAGDPDNGASVDTATCETSGTGFDELCTVWADPDFDPAAPAFYYARAVENPVCRWHMYPCNAAGVRCDDPTTVAPGLEGCCDPDFGPVIQERAWSSPIWYRPQ